MNRTKKMAPFNVVAAGAMAIVSLPVGLAYRSLQIRCKANGVDMTKALVASDIDLVRLLIDGDPVREFSGAELVALLDYYKVTWKDGILPLFFSDKRMRTAAGEDALILGTADVQNLTLEVTVNAGAVVPSLQTYAIQEGPNQPLGTFISVKRFSGYAAASAGEFHISDLPKGPYGVFAMHLDTTLISDIVVEANGKLMFEGDLAVAEGLALQNGRVPQAGYTHIDFNLSNRGQDILPLDLQEFRMKLVMAGASNFKVIMERAENRNMNAQAKGRAAL